MKCQFTLSPCHLVILSSCHPFIKGDRMSASLKQRRSLCQLLGRDFALGYTLLIPLILVHFVMLAYPILMAIWITLLVSFISLKTP